MMKLGCGSPDGMLKFVTCDDCLLSYDGHECKEFRQTVNVKSEYESLIRERSMAQTPPLTSYFGDD